jgi:hypothetical protein
MEGRNQKSKFQVPGSQSKPAGFEIPGRHRFDEKADDGEALIGTCNLEFGTSPLQR